MTTDPQHHFDRRLVRLLAVAVFAASILPFLPALWAGFCQYDDPGVLLQDPGYRGLSAKNVAWMFTSTRMGHYQPLTWLSYAVDYSLWGMKPVGFHLTNILLHGLNAALLYLIARRLISAALGRAVDRTIEIGAMAAALFFSLHPLRVESVAWITERRDVLSAAFLLGALLAYLRACTSGSVRWIWCALGLLLASLLSKAWGMSFFVLLLVIDWYPLRRLPSAPWRWVAPSARNVLLEKIPFAALGLAAAVMASYAVHSSPFTVMTLERWGIAERCWQACYGLVFYVWKSAWPSCLAMLYMVPRQINFADPRAFGAMIAVAAGLLAIALFRRRAPWLVAASLVYAVTLGPVLGFLQSGPQLAADRYSYIATMPWALVLGGGAALAIARVGLPRLVSLASLLLLALASLAARQAALWQDNLMLFKHTIDCGQGGAVVLELYGKELADRGRNEEALAQFVAANESDPKYTEAWYSRATTLEKLNREPEAEQVYRYAAGIMADSWRPNLMIGLMYLRRSGVIEAKAQAPGLSEAQLAALHEEHAAALRTAETCFRAAVANVESPYPQYFSSRPYLLLAAALDLQGKDREARDWLVKAARYEETRAEAQHVLSEMDAEKR